MKITNNIGILALIVALSLTVGWNASAATNIVLNSQNLQQAINNAAPGDTLVLQLGTYSANLVFSNAITVLCGIASKPNPPVILGGTVTIQGNGASAFQQIIFGNQVQILGTGTSIVSFAGCTFQNPMTTSGATVISSSNTFEAQVSVDLSSGSQTNLLAYDSLFSILIVNSGNALLKRCVVLSNKTVLGNPDIGIALTGTAFVAIRLTNYFGILSTAGAGAPFTLVQSQIGAATPTVGDYGFVLLYSNKVWMGYNEIKGPLFEQNCDSILIGNVICPYLNVGQALGVYGGTIKAYNNVFVSYNGDGVSINSLAGGGAEFVNNTVFAPSTGVQGAGGGFPITLRANAIVGGIVGSGPSWDISYCVVDQPVSVGAPFGGCIGCTPGFVTPDYTVDSSNLQLLTNSVCIGAGPPSPIYNNRGTTNRNDIGFTGGPFYNPGNYTNTNPMVYLLTGTPLGGTELIFPQGQTNIMSINAAASAGN